MGAIALGDEVRLGGVLLQAGIAAGVVRIGVGEGVEGNSSQPQVGGGATLGVGNQRGALRFRRRCAAPQLCDCLGMVLVVVGGGGVVVVVQGLGRGHAGVEATRATSNSNPFLVFGAVVSVVAVGGAAGVGRALRLGSGGRRIAVSLPLPAVPMSLRSALPIHAAVL